jgi:phosphohistidine phosphatase SixA
MTRRLVLLFFCLVAATANAAAQSPTTVVILVRHAEKAQTPIQDPPLTEAGVVRSYALATALLHTDLQAIIATELTRTQQTAHPTAEAHGIAVETVRTGGGEAHAKAVAAAVRAHAGQTVLVVGHTNTIPEIIAELGGPKLPDICDSQYSGFYTLILRGKKAELSISSYGAPSPDPETTCPKMK